MGTAGSRNTRLGSLALSRSSGPHLGAAAFVLIASGLAGCGARPQEASPQWRPLASPPLPTTVLTISPTADSPQQTSTALADRYAFPTHVDTTSRYLFYLHGRILEEQGLPARSPEFGEYRYEEILGELRSSGFVVVSEQRPRNANGWEYAQRTAQQVADLLAAGVPPGSITIVGASKGAAIAVGVSYLVGNPGVNYVLLATCHPSVITDWLQQGVTLSGNVLAIYDVADDEYSGTCQELFDVSEGKGLVHHEEIVLQVGTGHGIVYEPLPEWILPAVRWATQP